LNSWLDSLFGLGMIPTDGFTPLTDIEETEDAYLVELDLPGVRRDDIDITVNERSIVVEGERKEKERVGILRRRTRTVGRFRFEVLLPGAIEEEGVSAHIDNGVLTVRIPKAATGRPRHIEVK
jgi:HSP20 family protein